MRSLFLLGLAAAAATLICACEGGNEGNNHDAAGGSGGTSGSSGGTSSISGGASGDGGTPGSGGKVGIVDPPVGPADYTMTINASERHPISEHIYGINVTAMRPAELDALVEEVGFALTRAGGNRFSAYNWENNASNAGSDWHFHNDGYLSDSDTPGDALAGVLGAAQAGSVAALITTQLGSYVAADKDGTDVRDTADFLDTRYVDNILEKGGALSTTPDTTDGVVYQDEFINWVKLTYPAGKFLVSLDNEPDLWNHTHEPIWPTAPDYDEVARRNIASAKMVRKVLPEAEILGLASFGWHGWRTLGHADYDTKGEFLNYYLDKLAESDEADGQRLIDYVDVHWYPEARGDNSRITEGATTPGAIEARLQASRSLWDPSYIEDSWITESSGEAIQLLPRLQGQIDAHYPGTKLAIAEWDYGANTHISGGLATADVLGIFGREKVGQASHWHAGDDRRFTYGAFQIYRNYDGQGGRFGDVSVRALTSAAAESSVYAALDSNDESRMTVVLINKTEQPKIAQLNIEHDQLLESAQVYVLDESAEDTYKLTARPQGRPSLRAVSPNEFKYEMPPMSVSLLVASTEAELLPGPSWPAPTALGAATGWTFDADLEEWTIRGTSTEAQNSTLSWDAAEGQPASGAVSIEIPFTDREQKVEIGPSDGTLDLTGKKMSVNVKRTGDFDGGVMVYFTSGETWVAHGWTLLNTEEWETIEISPEMLVESEPTFDPSAIDSWGVMFNTGETGSTTPGTVTFHVDTAVTQSVN